MLNQMYMLDNTISKCVLLLLLPLHLPEGSLLTSHVCHS
jgi:hypothetical protein